MAPAWHLHRVGHIAIICNYVMWWYRYHQSGYKQGALVNYWHTKYWEAEALSSFINDWNLTLLLHPNSCHKKLCWDLHFIKIPNFAQVFVDEPRKNSLSYFVGGLGTQKHNQSVVWFSKRVTFCLIQFHHQRLNPPPVTTMSNIFF